VDPAPEVSLEIQTGLPRSLVDREVRRGGEGGYDTAQADALLAVRAESAS
jgi:hypothetical protein